jgi:MerR family copper efflux transcriptional regulator
MRSMRIGDVAQQLGVSTRALRHYEAAGLIRPTRLTNGYRVLSAAEVRKAEWVRDLIGAGFSTRELRRLLSAVDDGQAETACVAALRNKLEQIDCLTARLAERRRAVAMRLSAEERRVRDMSTPNKETRSDESPEHSGAALSAARKLRRGGRIP